MFNICLCGSAYSTDAQFGSHCLLWSRSFHVSNAHPAVVWINHAEAKIHRLDGDHELEVELHSHTSLQRLHYTRNLMKSAITARSRGHGI